MVVLMGCCRCGGKGRSNQRRWRSVVERMVVKPTVTLVVAEGTVEKEKGERETTEKEEKQGRWLVFWPNFDPIFSSLMP
jgi:hypothetical protein